MIGVCRLCDQNKKLIESHIIPGAVTSHILYNRNPKKDGARALVRDEFRNINHPKIPTDGYYDKNILCKECDSDELGKFDDYGARFLRADFSKFRRSRDNIFYYYGFPVDQKRFKLFAISMLWRASISNNEFFSDVALGPFEEMAKEFIKSSGVTYQDVFDVRLSHYYDISGINNISSMIQPFYRAKINLMRIGINFYVITLGKIEIGIKVDSQKLPKGSEVFFLNNENNFMLEKTYESKKGRIAITDATEQANALSRFF